MSETIHIISKLSSYISNQILKQPQRTIAPGEALISSGLINSFSLVDMALFIENEFGVQIEDTELNRETFDTLEQLAGIISERN